MEGADSGTLPHGCRMKGKTVCLSTNTFLVTEDEMGGDYLDLLELNAKRGGMGLGNWGERVRPEQKWWQEGGAGGLPQGEVCGVLEAGEGSWGCCK